jgi:hypothetical protein
VREQEPVARLPVLPVPVLLAVASPVSLPAVREPQHREPAAFLPVIPVVPLPASLQVRAQHPRAASTTWRQPHQTQLRATAKP